MNTAIWVVQVLLGAAFILSGVIKTTQPHDKIQKNVPYVEDLPGIRLRIVGAVELLGGFGVILPAWTGIAPILTPIAATGLMIVMTGAALLHVRRKEYSAIAVNAVLFALAAIVAWARFGPYAY